MLCCWLQVPGKDETGPLNDRWNHERIDNLLIAERTKGSTFVLPLATLIETGNHIARHRAKGLNVRPVWQIVCGLAADAQSPWAASDQSQLWQSESLTVLAQTWPALAGGGISIGDHTIKDVAEFYARGGFLVEILTSDAGLKAYEPVLPIVAPRRRR